MAQLINSESKRLARMVEIFLNVERLSAGQMELKREPISVKRDGGDLRGPHAARWPSASISDRLSNRWRKSCS